MTSHRTLVLFYNILDISMLYVILLLIFKLYFIQYCLSVCVNKVFIKRLFYFVVNMYLKKKILK